MRIWSWGGGLKERCAFFHHLAGLAVNKRRRKKKKKLLCSIFHSGGRGERSGAVTGATHARRQDLLPLDVHKTCTPMLALLHSSVAGVGAGLGLLSRAFLIFLFFFLGGGG